MTDAMDEYYRTFGRWLREEFIPTVTSERPGIFRDHSCARCKDGRDLSRCPTPDRPGNCGYPHARND